MPRWRREDHPQITRLTSGPLNNVNIYCEQPYATPDGKRVAYQRSATGDPRVPPYDLCVADLETLKVATLDTDVAGNWIGTSAWSGQLYCWRRGPVDGLARCTLWESTPTGLVGAPIAPLAGSSSRRSGQCEELGAVDLSGVGEYTGSGRAGMARRCASIEWQMEVRRPPPVSHY